VSLPSLGLVVIGRDAGPALQRLLAATQPYDFAARIFVDSGSRDDSGRLAANAGCHVVTLPRSIEGAAAARAAGTTECETDWILYLDSDMLPDASTLSCLHAALENLPPAAAGVSAQIRDVFPDGTTRLRFAHERTGQRASYFGGAVLLKRSSVLAAGNWNSRVIANEELDLHARLRAQGEHVVFHRVVLVDHYTDRIGVLRKIGLLINWRGNAGGRYGAPGQALRSCMEHGAVRHLVMLNPEPFVATPLTGLAVAALLAGAPWIAAGTLGALWAWITHRRGIQYIAPAYLLFPQIVIGYVRSGVRRK
jgi:hypothetical protein